MSDDEAVVQVSPGDSRAELYRWQTWVHVGPGADNCEDVDEANGTVSCGNPLHFHAWCRLPNQFQQEELREKALAAKARKMRLLREPGADLCEIMESEIEALARRGESVRPAVTEELVAQDWWRYLLDATRQLQVEHEDPDDDETPLRWEHIEDDRLKALALRADAAGDPEAADEHADELAMLEQRVLAYDAAVMARRDELAQPVRDELAALDISDLIDRLRDARIDAEGSKAYQATIAEWTWVTGSFRQVEGSPHFQSPVDLRTQPTDVIAALSSAFGDLEREKGGLAQGN